MNKIKKCYICSSFENLTKDHVPPENLFPKPKPPDLITVTCCKKCNEDFSLDDEAFRVFVASAINRSTEGERVWKEGVVASSFLRSSKLKANVAKSLIPASVETSAGTLELSALTFPEDRANKYLSRLTKGLLSHFYPHVDYSTATFEITQIAITQAILDNVLSFLNYDERGERVFRFWRTMSYQESEIVSLWVYVFYDALAFMVEVENLSI